MTTSFDRYPFMKHSTAAPFMPSTQPANNLRHHLKEVITQINQLDNEQLAALYAAAEVEHVNRMASMAGVE